MSAETPETITEAELAEALEAYSALGMSPAGFAKALFRDIRIARSSEIAVASPATGDSSEASPSSPESAQQRTGASEALPVAAAFDRATRLCPTCLHDEVLERTLDRAVAAEARLLELESALTSHTDCTRCAGFLDRAKGAEERAERAEAKLTALRTVLLEGGQDARAVRRRALALIGGEGEARNGC